MSDEERILATGKLPHALLKAFLRSYGGTNEHVLVGPSLGEDAAAIAPGKDVVVAGMDPITFATDEIGWYVVHVNANDVAVMGAAPRWFLVTFLLPEGQTTVTDVDRLFRQVADACNEVGASLIGGHTEITYDLSRPLAVGVMMGEVDRGTLVRTGGAQVGDALILARGVPIEGAAIIARERGQELIARGVPEDVVQRAAAFLHDPGISVVKAALVAVATVPVHAMHDPTEGGLLTGVWELAEASGVGVWLDVDAVPVLPEGRLLCNVLGLDPLGTIASGALLVACAPEDAQALIEALEEEGIPASVIGRMTSLEEGRVVHSRGKISPLVPPAVDEIVKVFEA